MRSSQKGLFDGVLDILREDKFLVTEVALIFEHPIPILRQTNRFF